MKKLFTYLVITLFLFACTNDVEEPQNGMIDNVVQTHTIVMNFDGRINTFDGEATRATSTFPDGATMYVTFANGSGLEIHGTAVYKTSISGWEMTYVGNLSNATNSTCSLYYFEGISSYSGEVLNLDHHSICYFGTGAYTKTSNSLNVTASLSPKCSRIRFKGTSGTNIAVGGLAYYSSFEITNSLLSSSDPYAAIYTSVNDDGYTPYIYYNDCVDSIILTIDGMDYSIKTPANMKSFSGKSGYLTIPTSTNHNGWTVPNYNSHEYVDLGLSVKWATCNVGADKPEEYGDYYAWGETETKSTYNRSTYKWCNGSYDTQTKYCTDTFYGTVDNKTTLDPEDDVAHVKWGGDWRMPTKAEIDELVNINNCTWTWVTQNGKNGYLVTSKKNGNSIFLPASGYRRDSSHLNASSYGSNYWSGSLNGLDSRDAYCLIFFSSYVIWDSKGRADGLSVRPVCP